jgi:acyl carrier protein
MNIMEELKKFVISEIAIDSDFTQEGISPDEDLIATGVIDSLGILKLVAFMEKQFGIKLKDEDITPENLRTLSLMAKFIETKLKMDSVK